MNENPELASSRNGVVLIHISCQATKAPKLKVEKVEDALKKKAMFDLKLFEKKEYDMIAEFG